MKAGGLVPQDNQYGNGVSNGHVTDDVT